MAFQDPSLAGIRHLVNQGNVRGDIDLSEIERRITGIQAAAGERDVPAGAAPPEANEGDDLAEARMKLKSIADDLGIPVAAGDLPGRQKRGRGAAEAPGLGDFVGSASSESGGSEESEEEGSEGSGGSGGSGSESGSEGGGGDEAPAAPRMAAPVAPASHAAQRAPSVASASYAAPMSEYAQPFAAQAAQGRVAMPAAWAAGPWMKGDATPAEIREGQIEREAGPYEDSLEQQIAQAERRAELVDEYCEMLQQAERQRLQGLERFPPINYDTPLPVIMSAHRALKKQLQGHQFTHVANDIILELASAAGDICDGSWALFGNFHPDLRGLRNSLTGRMPRMRGSMASAVKATFGVIEMSSWGEVGFEVFTAAAMTMTAAHRRRTAPASYMSQRRTDNIHKIAESAPKSPAPTPAGPDPRAAPRNRRSFVEPDLASVGYTEPSPPALHEKFG